MTTAKKIRKHNQRLTRKGKKELKSALNDYFNATFIKGHRPFRAVIGNKKCKPIPIDQTFLFNSGEELICYKIKWPNLSKELLRSELKKLGFVIIENRITENGICILVPPYEKGAKLTFAQEWVKRINDTYSRYCANEKKKAKEMYKAFLSELMSFPSDKVEIFDEYILFCEFKFSHKISPKCATFIRRLMMRDGIEPYYEEGEYMGIKVYTN